MAGYQWWRASGLRLQARLAPLRYTVLRSLICPHLQATALALLAVRTAWCVMGTWLCGDSSSGLQNLRLTWLASCANSLAAIACHSLRSRCPTPRTAASGASSATNQPTLWQHAMVPYVDLSAACPSSYFVSRTSPKPRLTAVLTAKNVNPPRATVLPPALMGCAGSDVPMVSRSWCNCAQRTLLQRAWVPPWLAPWHSTAVSDAACAPLQVMASALLAARLAWCAMGM